MVLWLLKQAFSSSFENFQIKLSVLCNRIIKKHVYQTIVPARLEYGELIRKKRNYAPFIRKHYDYLLSGLRGLRRPAPHPGSGAAPSLRGFSGDRSGVVVVLVALALPVLAGGMGLAAESPYWYVHQRGMQNAADAAAIAVATTPSTSL